jgi:glycine/D-amino acid oxidase-like deaminating enzyme
VTDVLVVGAGLLGASVAYHAAGQGLRPTIVDLGEPGRGTSGSSFAWINAQDKKPEAYFELNRRGVAAYPALEAALGGTWLHRGGDLLLGHGSSVEAVREKADRHAAVAYPVALLDRAQIAALEPGLRLPDGEVVGAHFPEETWVDAPDLVARLVAAAVARGGRLVQGSVTSLVEDGGRVTGVRLADGATLTADDVVVAAGPATEALAATAGVALPMAPSPGLLVTVAHAPKGVERVVHTGDVALRPDGAGAVLASSRSVDARLPADTVALGPDDEPVRDVLDRAAAWLPGLADADSVRVRVGIRSVATDGMPAVGRVGGHDGIYLLVTHSGATLAPVLGSLVAGELAGTAAPELEAYRPGRFGSAG